MAKTIPVITRVLGQPSLGGWQVQRLREKAKARATPPLFSLRVWAC